MARFKRGQGINQGLLLPPSLLDWLPDDHLAWFIRDAVESLDLDVLLDSYRVSGKAMSYERMNKEEERLKRDSEIQAITKMADDTDEAEDVEFGPDFRGDELPAELA